MCNHRTSTTVVFLSPRYRLTSILQLCRRQCLRRRCVQLQRQMRRRRGRKRKWENKIGSKFPILFLTKRTSFHQYFQPFLSILNFYIWKQQQQQQNSHSKTTNAQAKKVIFPPSFSPLFKGAFWLMVSCELVSLSSSSRRNCFCWTVDEEDCCSHGSVATKNLHCALHPVPI